MSKNIQKTKISKDGKGALKEAPGKLNKKRVGEIGESAAAAYLKHKGHEVLGRNIRLRRGEIDILTKKDTTLHIVEVKTSIVPVGSNPEGNSILPEEKFSKQKINRLKHLANVILAKYGRGDQGIQIDGIAVRLYQDKNKQEGPTKIADKITARFYEAIS